MSDSVLKIRDYSAILVNIINQQSKTCTNLANLLAEKENIINELTDKLKKFKDPAGHIEATVNAVAVAVNEEHLPVMTAEFIQWFGPVPPRLIIVHVSRGTDNTLTVVMMTACVSIDGVADNDKAGHALESMGVRKGWMAGVRRRRDGIIEGMEAYSYTDIHDLLVRFKFKVTYHNNNELWYQQA
jgi:hypothetical protein